MKFLCAGCFLETDDNDQFMDEKYHPIDCRSPYIKKIRRPIKNKVINLSESALLKLKYIKMANELLARG